MNPEQLNALRQEIRTDPAGAGYAALGQDYPAIANLLNARPQIPNPAAQSQVPKRFTLVEFLAAASSNEALLVMDKPVLCQYIADAVARNDRAAMGVLLGLMEGLVSAQTRVNLAAMLAATEPDPAWSETVAGVSRSEVLGLPIILASDVQQVM